MLPPVASSEHFGEEFFAVGKAIVAEIEEMAESGVESGIGAAQLLEGAPRGEGVERCRVFGGLEVAAEAREQGTVVRDAQAEGIDGFNGESLRMVEDVPAAACGLRKSFVSGSDAGNLIGREMPG